MNYVGKPRLLTHYQSLVGTGITDAAKLYVLHTRLDDGMNKFQEIIERRIRALTDEAKSAGAPEHNATAGFLREKYITRFLRDMTPPNISLASGVVFDLTDQCSPQIDLVAKLDEVLPSIVLHDDVSMVPIEAALLSIEIKSKFEASHLDQISKQNKWIANVRVVLPNRAILPTAILALDGLSAPRVIEWLGNSDSQNTVMCCVIGKYHLIRQNNEIRQIDADGRFGETMHFVSDYYKGLMHLRELRRAANSAMVSDSPYPSPLEAYLKGMHPSE